MAVLMPYTCYLHVPKTGGTWARKVLSELVELRDEAGAFHGLPKLQEIQHRRLFTFVRHPASWLRSYFLHRCRECFFRHTHPPGSRWDDVLDAFDPHYVGHGWEDFALSVAREPGLIGQAFAIWTDAFPNLTTVGRIDVDPAGFLASIVGPHELNVPPGSSTIGEIAKRIRSVPRKNVHTGERPELTDRVLDALAESERPFLERFGYDRSPPGPAAGDGSV